MSLALIALIVVAGLYVGWNIGANDSANCVGAVVGAGLMRFRTGILLVAVFAIAGAMFHGGNVVKTLGKGIVTESLPPLAVLAALLCGGFFVSVATFKKIPVSTSQSVVGAVAGVGLAADLSVDFSKLLVIIECWILCPIMSGVAAWGILHLTRWVMKRIKNKQLAEKVLSTLVILSACYASYSLGANNLGNAIGPIVVLDVMDIAILSVLGAVSIGVGAITFGRGVVETVGKSITRLNLKSAFAAQVASAFGLHFFSMIGIPVSTSQAIVGAVLGVGLVHGARTVSKRKLGEIALGWVLIPVVSGSTAWLIYLGILKLS